MEEDSEGCGELQNKVAASFSALGSSLEVLALSSRQLAACTSGLLPLPQNGHWRQHILFGFFVYFPAPWKFFFISYSICPCRVIMNSILMFLRLNHRVSGLSGLGAMQRVWNLHLAF